MSERVDVFLLRRVSQQGLAEATHSCTVQSAEFLALWFVMKLREQGSGFYLNAWCSLPCWAIAAPWTEQAGVTCVCTVIIGQPEMANFRLSDCQSFQSHLKQPLESGVNRSKLAKCIYLQFISFYFIFEIMFKLLHPTFKKSKAKFKPAVGDA